ncbi:MAG: LegC family aminotransferase [bacterium]
MKSDQNVLEPALVVKSIRDAIGPGPAALHEPKFSGNEWDYLKQCLDSTYVSSVGKYVDKFEHELAAFTGAKYAIAVVNGTAALHISLLLSNVTREDEVLLPALTFVATANAISYCGAIPHFVDSEENTLGIDPEKLYDYLKINSRQKGGNCVSAESGRIIRAIVPMHTFGHPSKMEQIAEIAKEFGLEIIEDATESLGSYYKGQHTGTFGAFGTLSFNGNKTITTGGGGAILTNDSEKARLAKHLSTTAKKPHPWEYVHDQIAYNYRLPNINAALGCAQLEQLPDMLRKKRNLFRKYQQSFRQLEGLKLFSEPDDCKSNYWLQTLILDIECREHRDLILKETNSAGFMTRPVWNLLSEMSAYQECPKMNLDCANSLSNRVVSIPSSAFLDDQ